jgi:hypothetical protein
MAVWVFVSIILSYQNELYHLSASWAQFVLVNLVQADIWYDTFLILLWNWILWQNTKLICIGLYMNSTHIILYIT